MTKEHKVIVVSLFLPITLNIKKSGYHSHDQIELLDPWLIPSHLGNVGLQNAINSHLIKDKSLWVGILSTQIDCLDHAIGPEWRTNVKQDAMQVGCCPVMPTDKEMEGHYEEFCKQVLWKPFHYQLQDHPKGTSDESSSWINYCKVNQLFAQVIAENYEKGDIVWINDYHLMLVPQMLRELIPDAAIGFFLHVPFPSSEIFRCIHVRKEILRGLLGADLVGFQTYSFMRHFLMTCTRLLSLESTPKGIQLDNRDVSVGIFPIGIDLNQFKEKEENPKVAELIQTLKEKYAGLKIIFGRDKNDYVKGVRQKMLAFEMFLEKYPEWIGKVVLIQVSLTTTEANQNETNVADVVSRINSKFGTIEYTPVVYVCQDIDFSHYLSLLTLADACLITSLRDGMNLTSHEYVVCQQGKHSPLIISEFTGTYGSMGAAIRINPWDRMEVADAIHEALIMGEEEKTARWTELYSFVSHNSAQNYVQSYLNELQKVHESAQHTLSTAIPPLNQKVLYDGYFGATGRRIFFLDDDGTLMPSNVDSIAHRHTLEQAKKLVTKLLSDPRNIVYLVSGRRKEELQEDWDIPRLGIGAENGGFIKYPDQYFWEPMLDETDTSWKNNVEEIFEYYTDRTPGSFIEVRELSLVWHYGLADLEFASWQAAECQTHIEQGIALSYPIHCMAKKKSIQVSLRSVNKGNIIKQALDYHRWMCSINSADGFHSNSRRKLRKPSLPIPCSDERREEYFDEDPIDFICCLGDDRSDESMFEVLLNLETKFNSKEEVLVTRSLSRKSSSNSLIVKIPPLKQKVYISCTIGPKSSSSKFYLPNYRDVHVLLENLLSS